jgi:K+-sensing histidine kinase KdpD
MLERITINLTGLERQALEAVARAELRNIREQARFTLRQELERRGLLKNESHNRRVPPARVHEEGEKYGRN